MAEEPSRELKAVLRHGCAACRTECRTTAVPDVRPGDAVIARTDRGVEYALILTPAEEAGAEDPEPPVEVLRRATAEDTRRQAEIDTGARSEEFRFCRDRVRERDLPMRLVRVEKILGGQRIIFYFMADGRVDFRDLVRDLARQFRMRIELKQIGARDEAKVLGDVSYCGRELCCSSWIREMKPITMKMAKNAAARRARPREGVRHERARPPPGGPRLEVRRPARPWGHRERGRKRPRTAPRGHSLLRVSGAFVVAPRRAVTTPPVQHRVRKRLMMWFGGSDFA
jgi:hypothetical protein